MSFIFNSTLAQAGSAVVDAAKTNKVLQRVALAAVVGAALLKIRGATKAASAKAKFAAQVKSQKKGVVHIYAFPRLIAGLPHIAGTVIKIEAFCRINKVPYVMEMSPHYAAFSPSETMPFIALDGELTGDSQFCVDAIAKRFNLPEATLSGQERAISVLVRKTLDMSLTQHLNRTNFVDNGPVIQKFFADYFAPLLGVPAFLVPFGFGQYRKQIINKLNTSGLGWMNTERYLLEFTRDVEAIAFLVEESQRKGNKYLFGNTPTSADCFLFGVVACNAPHAKNITVNTSAVDIMTTHPALVKFCKDFEAEIYPDLNTISPCGVTSQSFA